MNRGGLEGPRVHRRPPAKVNLGLRLVGQRADGYHLLESIFAPVSLFDDLVVERLGVEGDVELELSMSTDADLPPALAAVTSGPDNLVVRAAEAFRQRAGIVEGLRISLEKRIPSGAGLGGGSSDAGAVLSALAELFGTSSPAREEIFAAALRLGADVPYFLAPRPALVQGIGERIEPLAGLPPFRLVVANAGVSVATAEVYRIADALPGSLTDTGAGSTMRSFSRLRDQPGDWASTLGALLVNDLEPAATRLCPPIGRLLGQMRDAGALGAGLSGSGGTVFGVFSEASSAEEAAKFLRGDSAPGRDAAWVREAQVLC